MFSGSRVRISSRAAVLRQGEVGGYAFVHARGCSSIDGEETTRRRGAYPSKALILAARMKSFSESPSIAWVQTVTSTRR